MKNFIERDGKNFWQRKSPSDTGAVRLIAEEKIARFIMLKLRRRYRTVRYLQYEIKRTFLIQLSDKDLRGILRRMQIQGKPVVSTFYGFALASKSRIEQQAKRMLRHGWAEIQYSRKLLGSRLWDRLVGQIKLKVKI